MKFSTKLILASLTATSLQAKDKTSIYAPKLFISVDGAQPADLEWMINQKIVKGELASLKRKGVWVEKAEPIATTLTAPSHASIITCSPPAVHGIYSNTFRANGKTVSGFAAPLKAETFWQSAQRQGKTVLSISYPAADGASPERSPNWGVTYPDSKQISNGIFWEVPLTKSQPVTGQLVVTLNPETQETATIVLRWDSPRGHKNPMIAIQNPAPTWTRLQSSADLPAPHGQLITQELQGPHQGRYRAIQVIKLSAQNNRLRLFVSGATYTNAYPEAFLRFLESKNLFWPETNFKPLQNDPDVSPVLYTQIMGMIDRYLTTVAEISVRQFKPDIVLFYQPLVDSLGHASELNLPRPLGTKTKGNATKNIVTQAYKVAYRQVDKNISSLAKNAEIVMVVGDHGMEPTHTQLNIRKAMEGFSDRLITMGSGALALLYASKGEVSNRVTEAAKSHLLSLNFQGQQAVGEVLIKDPESPWNYGEAQLAVMAGPGFWFSLDPSGEDLFTPAVALGTHGHSAQLPTMATMMAWRTPKDSRQTIPRLSLIDAIPTFSDRLDLTPPKDCRGTVVPALKPAQRKVVR